MMWMVAAYSRITGWLGLRIGGQRTRTIVFCSKKSRAVSAAVLLAMIGRVEKFLMF